MRSKILLYLFLIILNVTKSNAQDNSGCLTKHQLFKIPSSSLDDIRMFLNNENWSFNGAKSNQSYNYFDYPINYNIVSWEKSSYYNEGNIILYNSTGKPNIVIYQSDPICFNDLLKSFTSTKGKTSVDEDKLITIFQENSITIEFREYKNDYSRKQYSILVYNSNALLQELQILKEKEDALKRAAAEQEKKYENALAEGDILFSSSKFEEAKLKYLTALEIENNVLIQSKIDLCDKAICEKIISKGDFLYNANKYEMALSLFKEANNCSKSMLTLQEKIKITEKKILDGKINTIQDKADLYFNDKKYDLALDNYNSILLLDKPNVYASEKIKQIQEIKNILEKRSTTVFSYKKTNKNDLIQFQNLLLDDMKLQINKYGEGSLNLNYLISFDTLGNNLSVVKNISTSLTAYTTNLSNITSNAILKPSSEGGCFLASQENLTFDVKWSTTKNLFKSNSKGIFQNEYPNQNLNSVENFINKQPFKYGKYISEIKNKEVNGKSYSNINLVKYSTVGPEAALFSMLMPGMGTLKVTHGKKGWGRFTCFLISSGLTIGSKLYSDSQYKSYLNATSQTDIDKYYTNANISNKIALISGVISASIYLHDIIWVISKGAKNLKSSKPLRRQLQQGPVQIQNQTISWQ
ncbi:MAG: hypothetical protein ACJAX7_002388 [Saprospiraceae bacterium]|jgi:hypothetical protein